GCTGQRKRDRRMPAATPHVEHMEIAHVAQQAQLRFHGRKGAVSDIVHREGGPIEKGRGCALPIRSGFIHAPPPVWLIQWLSEPLAPVCRPRLYSEPAPMLHLRDCRNLV